MTGTCNRCGSATTNARLCKNCQVWQAGPVVDETDHRCPSCEGPTSGEGVICYDCRGDS
jgi:hypothetical protein